MHFKYIKSIIRKKLTSKTSLTSLPPAGRGYLQHNHPHTGTSILLRLPLLLYDWSSSKTYKNINPIIIIPLNVNTYHQCRAF